LADAVLSEGTDEKPGLWSVETLLTHKLLLKALCKKVPVAMVTGRPRLV
jgi:hypothetical protein